MKSNKRLSEKIITEINGLSENHGVSVMDAILHCAEKYNIEIETIAPIIKSNSKIKALLQEEAEGLKFLPKTSKLPI